MTDSQVVDAAGRVSARQLAELDAACFAAGDVWSEHAWQQELDGGDRVVLVVGPGVGAPVAAATFQVVADTADLHRVMVSPGARGRRLGEHLLQEGLLRCGQRGAERMLLEVESDNHPALALYRRLGFEQVASRANYYGPGRTAQVLQRSLARVAVGLPASTDAGDRRDGGAGGVQEAGRVDVPAGLDEGSLRLSATEGGRS